MSAGSKALGVLSAAVVGFGIFAASNLNAGVRAKAWEGECLGRMNGAVPAELAWYAEHEDYVACGDRVGAESAARKPDPWLVADDPTFHCLSEGLGRWIDEEGGHPPTITAQLSATDRTRTGIWTEVFRAGDRGAIGFSVHTFCDFRRSGDVREAVVTTLGAPPGELTYRNSTPGRPTWETRQSMGAYLPFPAAPP